MRELLALIDTADITNISEPVATSSKPNVWDVDSLNLDLEQQKLNKAPKGKRPLTEVPLCKDSKLTYKMSLKVCEEEQHSEAINPDSLQHSQYLNVDSDDTYLLFRDNFLSNVVNCRSETSRPLHLYKSKVQGTTIIGMLDSGAQINCVSQHIV